MNALDVLASVFASVAVLAALYVGVSRDLLRVTFAFFVELAAVGGVLLSLTSSFMALLVFSIGLMGTVLVISFASVITGSLKDSFRGERATRSQKISQALGMLLGLGLGAAVGWAFLTAPYIDHEKWTAALAAAREPDVKILGRLMLGQQLAVFELLGIMLLAAVVGAGLLLRKPENAD